ncbi:hypothetical protein VL20_4827 [Microcystis panniformis FACHB-1757]|uniref:Uncharacterized protein n=1 Tax=Microcystis panniformis FACHB-1757 TaxID=1638788 RepID=A0A0K1S6E2_9CHRO|nr:hypothetical protein VL20_4827 [Microcystis panniformis FACHB-1757]
MRIIPIPSIYPIAISSTTISIITIRVERGNPTQGGRLQ